MNCGHEDVTRPVVAELHDEFGEIGLPRVDARGGKRLVEFDLLSGHRLDLDHFRGASAADQIDDDAVGLVRVARPMHLCASGRRLLFELQQVGVEVA
ncbi:Uncharacterised protein [Mycobacteroides abscessus subsp. abscessus]|nr:Uncharacterised protein [Mycobacteroides abscessus subsp. abscessus]